MQDSVIALLKACEQSVSHGSDRVILVKKWKKPPRGNWGHKRILPGVYGRIIGSTSSCTYIVDVPVRDLIGALEKVMRVNET